MNKELKSRLEDLEWWIEKADEPDLWYLSKYSPAGEDFGFYVRNSHFLEDVGEFVDDFDANDHVASLAQYRGTNGVPESYRVLVDDAEDIKDMLIELYNGIKDLEVFNGNARKESQEEAD